MQGALTPFCRLSPDATFYVSNVIYLLILAVRIEVVKRYKKMTMVWKRTWYMCNPSSGEYQVKAYALVIVEGTFTIILAV
jgi:hypothetical protein